MDFFMFAIYSIIALIFLHFVFYYHNIDIIDMAFGQKSSDSVPEPPVHNEENKDKESNVVNEKHINELLQGLEELNKEK